MDINPYESPSDTTQKPVGKSYAAKVVIRAVIVIPIFTASLVVGYLAGGLLYRFTHSEPAKVVPFLAYASSGALICLLQAIRFVRWLIVRLELN